MPEYLAPGVYVEAFSSSYQPASFKFRKQASTAQGSIAHQAWHGLRLQHDTRRHREAAQEFGTLEHAAAWTLQTADAKNPGTRRNSQSDQIGFEHRSGHSVRGIRTVVGQPAPDRRVVYRHVNPGPGEEPVDPAGQYVGRLGKIDAWLVLVLACAAPQNPTSCWQWT